MSKTFEWKSQDWHPKVHVDRGVSLYSAMHKKDENAFVVWLDHSCDEWVIAESKDPAEAIKQVRSFIAALENVIVELGVEELLEERDKRLNEEYPAPTDS